MSDDPLVDEIVIAIGKHFRTFGGENVNKDNPISIAMKDRPSAFAAGVDVRSVVQFVVTFYRIKQARGHHV